MLRYLQWRESKEKEEYENSQRRERERQHLEFANSLIELAKALENANVNKESGNGTSD